MASWAIPRAFSNMCENGINVGDFYVLACRNSFNCSA
jgi:hypothetical protein